MHWLTSAGINGWFPVKLPAVGWDVQSEDGRHGNRGIERVVGGLELSLKFGHHDDAERVEQAARGVGWAPDFDIGHRDWDEAGRGSINQGGRRPRGSINQGVDNQGGPSTRGVDDQGGPSARG